jgi:TPR repeat protein
MSSVPLHDFAIANEELAKMCTEQYYSCCGKYICGGCPCAQSGNFGKCPFCKTEIGSKTDEEGVEELMKRVDVNDAGAMYILGSYYTHGQLGLQQDLERTIALWKHSAELGYSQAHNQLGVIYEGAGDLKKAKFHYDYTPII